AATGTARAVGLVIPELQGKFNGIAFRVPVSTVSVVDFVATLNRAASVDEINAAMREAAQGELKGILAYTEEPLVSSDLKANTRSSILSSMHTMPVGHNMAKVVS